MGDWRSLRPQTNRNLRRSLRNSGSLCTRRGTWYLSVLRVSKKVEVWCELESVAGVVEDFGVQGDFLVGLKVRGVRGDEDVDPRFLLLAVRGLVGSRGLSEE